MHTRRLAKQDKLATGAEDRQPRLQADIALLASRDEITAESHERSTHDALELGERNRLRCDQRRQRSLGSANEAATHGSWRFRKHHGPQNEGEHTGEYRGNRRVQEPYRVIDHSVL